ncbi:hypothetical protein EDB85DRAFT_1895249 [Lactarius pseudohatsudake]|nr:hypothetical protein EDB85DRAFT_1895249 [Lactarius pseudohatsudake]
MARSKQTTRPPPRPPQISPWPLSRVTCRIPVIPRSQIQVAKMSSSGSRPKKRKKYPPPWRKPEDVELSEEIRDLQRDIATHSTSTASVAPLAEDKQPRSQEHSESERDHPTASRTRRRRSTSTNKRAPRRKLEVPDLSTELHDLEHDAILR